MPAVTDEALTEGSGSVMYGSPTVPYTLLWTVRDRPEGGERCPAGQPVGGDAVNTGRP
jgi:hypothetical protein